MKIKFSMLLLFVAVIKNYSQEIIQPNKNQIVLTNDTNGKLENGIYTCNLFDWKITVPENYKITEKERIEELEKKGYEAITTATNVEVNKHPTQLIGFERNKYNYFTASFESLGKTPIKLKDHKEFIEKLTSETYSKIKELKFESSSVDLKLGQYIFYKIQIRLYNAKNDKLLLTQELYNSFINNHLFSVSINYTNEEDGILLNYVLKKSFE